MKKRFTTFIALIMAIIMGLAVVSGCNLVTSDNDRDMAQVVATVNIGNEGAKTEEITKKQLIMSYINYAYSIYNSNSNYSTAEIFEILLNQLINNRIMVQYAMKWYEEEGGVVDPTIEKWNVERYLDEEEKVDAEYTSIKSINDLIDSYVKEDDEYADTDTQTVRTVPTDAKNAEEELSYDEKKDYIKEGIVIGDEGSDRRKAYNDVLKLLENNGLLGKDFDGNLKDSDYYKETLKTAEENALLDKYDEQFTAGVRSKISYDTLCEKYVAMYEKQVNDYTGNKSDFESALSSATASNPVVYCPYPDGTYGYVYNLLIGVDDAQKAEISALASEITDKNEYARKRGVILQGLTAKDLRSTWIEAGYDFDYDNMAFTGDYTFCADDPFGFLGEVDLLREKTDKKDAQYKATSARLTLDEVLNVIEEYIYGEVKTADNRGTYLHNNASVYAQYADYDMYDDNPAEYRNKINELLFAFSTDSGSLNTFMGYSITPKPDAGGSETYMQEFADAGRDIVQGGVGKYGYMAVATDYGYHIMFYSQSFYYNSDAAHFGFSTLESYLNYMGYGKTEEDWADEYDYMLENYKDYDKKSFLYIFANQCSDADNALSGHRTEILKKYKYNQKYVVKYADRYADLGSN